MNSRVVFKIRDRHINYDFINRDHDKTKSVCKRIYVLCVFLLAVVFTQTVMIIVLARNTSCPETDTGSSLSAEHITEKSNVDTDPNSLCFRCGEIGENITSNDTGNIITVDKKTNMCCMENVGNLRKLFLVIINEYYRNVSGNFIEMRHGPEASNPTQSEGEVPVGPVSSDGGGNHSHQLKAPSISHSLEFWDKRAAAAHMFIDNKRLRHSNETVPVGPVSSDGGGNHSHQLKAPSISHSLDFWNKRVAAAHMFIDNKLLGHSNETAPRIPWEGHDYHNLSMISHLLIYRPGSRSIQVKVTGLFFVYSSVTLQAPATDLNAQVYHMLLKEHYQLPNTGSTIMMMNKYGGGKQSSGFYTSFLCGAFRLRQDDELFVKVSNISFLYNSYYSNYLGLYMLSG